MTTAASPLETLVIQQLTHLIEEEKTLATKYPSLSTSPDQQDDRKAAFSNGLQELRRRAESLQRFVDAMEEMGLRDADAFGAA